MAEEACGFEHRDLHWGNILIKTTAADKAQYKLRGHAVTAATAGLAVTLIDFTASRLKTFTGDLAFCDLAADPELFQGPKGDCQVRCATLCYRHCFNCRRLVTDKLGMYYDAASFYVNHMRQPFQRILRRAGFCGSRRWALPYAVLSFLY